jgi:hypothetical protein
MKQRATLNIFLPESKVGPLAYDKLYIFDPPAHVYAAIDGSQLQSELFPAKVIDIEEGAAYKEFIEKPMLSANNCRDLAPF